MSEQASDIPAFPFQWERSDPYDPGVHTGMSLRDYFAAAAMPVLAPRYDRLPFTADLFAQQCFMIADAMLAESQRRKDES